MKLQKGNYNLEGWALQSQVGLKASYPPVSSNMAMEIIHFQVIFLLKAQVRVDFHLPRLITEGYALW